MSRVIQFRAWSVNDKRMLPVGRLLWSIGGLHAIGGGVPISKHSDVVKDENLILMQFTGLHDKHGKEIYEGDVVKWKDRGSEYPIVLIKTEVVHWVNVGWNLNSKIVEYEILGNIYEHPELTPK